MYFIDFGKGGQDFSILALKSEDVVRGPSKTDNLMNWLGMDMEGPPILQTPIDQTSLILPQKKESLNPQDL